MVAMCPLAATLGRFKPDRRHVVNKLNTIVIKQVSLIRASLKVIAFIKCANSLPDRGRRHSSVSQAPADTSEDADCRSPSSLPQLRLLWQGGQSWTEVRTLFHSFIYNSASTVCDHVKSCWVEHKLSCRRHNGMDSVIVQDVCRTHVHVFTE